MATENKGENAFSKVLTHNELCKKLQYTCHHWWKVKGKSSDADQGNGDSLNERLDMEFIGFLQAECSKATIWSLFDLSK